MARTEITVVTRAHSIARTGIVIRTAIAMAGLVRASLAGTHGVAGACVTSLAGTDAGIRFLIIATGAHGAARTVLISIISTRWTG